MKRWRSPGDSHLPCGRGYESAVAGPRQVEQDLIICRALCDLFNAPALAEIAFRGGTAIHKLLFKQPLRYSEDIDLVQTQPGPSVARSTHSRSVVVAREVQPGTGRASMHLVCSKSSGRDRCAGDTQAEG